MSNEIDLKEFQTIAEEVARQLSMKSNIDNWNYEKIDKYSAKLSSTKGGYALILSVYRQHNRIECRGFWPDDSGYVKTPGLWGVLDQGEKEVVVTVPWRMNEAMIAMKLKKRLLWWYRKKYWLAMSRKAEIDRLRYRTETIIKKMAKKLNSELKTDEVLGIPMISIYEDDLYGEIWTDYGADSFRIHLNAVPSHLACQIVDLIQNHGSDSPKGVENEALDNKTIENT